MAVEWPSRSTVLTAVISSAVWATTRPDADVASQVETLTGGSLADEAFFHSTLATVTALLVEGVRPRAVQSALPPRDGEGGTPQA